MMVKSTENVCFNLNFYDLILYGEFNFKVLCLRGGFQCDSGHFDINICNKLYLDVSFPTIEQP